MVTLLAAFVLVFVAFPNPFKVPLNNPNPTAELAPVPGEPGQSAPGGNFSEGGFAGGGLGGGPGDPGGGVVQLPPPVEIPLQHDCVNGRQTEDPFSPPCTPWEGDNKGSTYKYGVTGTEIRVIFYNDLCIEGDLGQQYQPTDECGSESDFQTVNIVRTVKAQLAYFQRRFQTYGRRVHLIGQKGNGADPEARKRDATTAFLQYKPFATVFVGDNAQDYFAEMGRRGVPSFGLNYDVPRDDYEQNAPFVWSFVPDQETEAKYSASYLCRMVLGRDGLKDANKTPPKARFSSDPVVAAKNRKLGFVYGVSGGRGPAMEQLAAKLMANMKQECGYEFRTSNDEDYQEPEYGYVESYQNQGAEAANNAALIVARMQQAGVTTVVCYCIPVPTEQAVSKFQSAATQTNYWPEWYWDHASAMDRPVWHQTYSADPTKKHVSFGVTSFWRQPAFRKQMHYQAYVDETRDNSVPNVRFNFTIYYLFLNLFTAIQAAGPDLNPESVERGMFTFKYLDASNPWIATGGYGRSTPGTYTFIDTAMAWFWDPTGTPPGGKQGEGCMRVMDEGRRYAMEGAPKLAPRWPTGDTELWEIMNNGSDGKLDPCTEDTRKIRDPQAGDLH